MLRKAEICYLNNFLCSDDDCVGASYKCSTKVLRVYIFYLTFIEIQSSMAGFSRRISARPLAHRLAPRTWYSGGWNRNTHENGHDPCFVLCQAQYLFTRGRQRITYTRGLKIPMHGASKRKKHFQISILVTHGHRVFCLSQRSAVFSLPCCFCRVAEYQIESLLGALCVE